MAIISTGAIYKSLVFDGEDSRDYGVYITGQAVYNAPERDVEMISIPGRNGSFALDKGRFQNIEVTYPAGIFADNEADFAQGISDFRNFLCSRNGYVRLTDDYNPDEYRMAVYKSGLDVSPAQLKAGEFNIVFDCKPQRFLTSGEEPITIGEWHETETASGEIASFEAEAGDAVKSLVADIEPIQDLHGYDKPWSGGTGRNKYAVQIGRDTFLDRNSATHTRNNDVLTINATSTKNSGVVTASSATLQQLTASLSGTYTYSFDIKASVEGFIDIGFASAGSMSLGVVTGWHRVSITSSDFNATEKTFEVRNGGDGSARTIEIRNFMIQEGSTATDYEPYSNICPISGYDSVVVSRCGKNLFNPDSNFKESFDITGSGAIRYGYAFKSGEYTISSKDLGASSYYYRTPTKDLSNRGTSVLIPSNSSINVTVDSNHMLWVFTADSTFANADKLAVINGINQAFEPYNGNAYTTDLSGTRYGGTLDVVSGVLTVKYGIVTIDGDTVTVTNNGQTAYSTRAFFTPSPAKANGTSNMISDKFAQYTGADTSGVVSGRAGSGGVEFFLPPTVANTSAAVNAWFASNNTQLCYELATPTTVQLTAQEVELLVGLNQVWANSGDVEVEYGTAPNVLINPTLFESSPMLEVEGYGEIGVNGDVITIQNGELGEIKISDATQEEDVFLDVSNLNADDAIYSISGQLPCATMSLKLADASGTLDVTKRSSVTGGTAYISKINGYASEIRMSPVTTGGLSFRKGWSHTYTTTLPLTITINGTATNCTLTLTTVYNGGANTISLVFGGSDFPESGLRITSKYSHPVYYGSSTKVVLPSPMYIDLDLGEAYGEVSDEITSFNSIVQMPANPPTLKAGANEITFDDTITDLKVIPRWWRV